MEYLEKPYLPHEVDDVTLAFPANVKELMPPWEDIPKELPELWVKFQRTWFFKGLAKETKLYAKDGIDPEMAMRHLAAIQGSFEPKHEYKEAAVAYLASLWFDDWEES